MPAGIGYPDEQTLTTRAIDDLLGEPARQSRQPPALGAPEPIPWAAGPIAPPQAPEPPPISAPRGGDTRFDELSNVGETPTLTRETSAAPGVVDVGARGGASTMDAPPEADTPPPPPSAPPPPAPPSAPNVDTGVTAPRSTGAGATNPQDAYNNLIGSIDPNASQADMEAAIDAAYQDVPGYEGAYKESVKISGKWYDLVGGYGGPGAKFHGMMAKTGGSGAGTGFMNLAGSLGGGIGGALQDPGRLDAILAAIDAMSRGVDSPLNTPAIDAALAEGPPLQNPAIAPVSRAPTAVGRRLKGS